MTACKQGDDYALFWLPRHQLDVDEAGPEMTTLVSYGLGSLSLVDPLALDDKLLVLILPVLASASSLTACCSMFPYPVVPPR